MRSPFPSVKADLRLLATLLAASLIGVGSLSAETVRVLSYNLFHGGDAGKQPRARSIEVIEAAAAPIAALQETKGKGPNDTRPDRGPAIARALGWNYFDQENNNGVASEFPIIGHTPKKHGVKVQLRSGDALWVFNVHLAPRPYQPHQIYKIPQKNAEFIDDEASAIAAARQARGHQVAELLGEIENVRKDNSPIVLVGDFNEPSEFDWTKATAAAGKCRFPVAWPTTATLREAGFVDCYRHIFPNAVEHPGLTWTPTLPEDTQQDHHDRIDYIFADRATLAVEGIQILGERKERADIVVSPTSATGGW